MSAPAPDVVVARTREWIERAVIGLNLCPFARAVHEAGAIRCTVSEATTPDGLLQDLEAELGLLEGERAGSIETTLLIHPHVLTEFLEYNDFLERADRTLKRLGLEGVIQIASFHPGYQFADAAPEDISNFTNRSPYPMLHLLREDRVEAALTDFPDPGQIYRRNVETLRRLGREGWSALFERDDA